MDETLAVSGFVSMLGGLSFLVVGPLGMVVVGLIVLSVGVVDVSGGGRTDAVNCSACGAPNSQDDEVCTHCGTSL